MSIESTSSVAKFVKARANELLKQEIYEQRQQEQKPVTVRLPSGFIAIIDRLASDLDMNRQSFLMELIHESLKDSIAAMSESVSSEEETQRETYMEYQALMYGDLV